MTARAMAARLRQLDRNGTVQYVLAHVLAGVAFTVSVAATAVAVLTASIDIIPVRVPVVAAVVGVIAMVVGIAVVPRSTGESPGPAPRDVPANWDTIGGRPVAPDSPSTDRWDSHAIELERLYSAPAYQRMRPAVPPADHSGGDR